VSLCVCVCVCNCVYACACACVCVRICLSVSGYLPVRLPVRLPVCAQHRGATEVADSLLTVAAHCRCPLSRCAGPAGAALC
jgi:hypothetical protein